MNEILSAYDRLERAQEEFRLASEELKAASANFDRAIEKNRLLDWNSIEQKSKGRHRRTKGEIENYVVEIFRRPRRDSLNFMNIYDAVRQMTLTPPSESTVRHTLYRMRKKGLLECYSGRWSPGQKMQPNNHEGETQPINSK